MSEPIRLGEGPITKGYQYVGFRDGERLYVELRECISEWVMDTIEIDSLDELNEYIQLYALPIDFLS